MYTAYFKDAAGEELFVMQDFTTCPNHDDAVTIVEEMIAHLRNGGEDPEKGNALWQTFQSCTEIQINHNGMNDTVTRKFLEERYGARTLADRAPSSLS